MTGISRRNFNKALIGTASLATASLAIPPRAVAAGISGEGKGKLNNFTNDLIPICCNFKLVHKNKKALLFKDEQGVDNNDYLEINGLGSSFVQLSRGVFPVSLIVDLLSDVYNLSKEDIDFSVRNFIKFLFDEGYLVFASSQYLNEGDRKIGRGINLLNKTDCNIKVTYKNKKSVNIIF